MSQNFLAYRQTKASATYFLIGVVSHLKKGLADMFQVFGTNPNTCVWNWDFYLTLSLEMSGFDDDFALWGKLNCIADEVDQYLGNPVFIHQSIRKIALQFGVYDKVVVGGKATQVTHDLFD